MSKVALGIMLVLGLLVLGIWGGAAYEDRRAHSLQVQATRDLAQTVQVTQWAWLAQSLCGSFVFGAALSLYAYYRLRRMWSPIRRWRSGGSSRAERAMPDRAAMWWAYRLGQQDTLQVLRREDYLLAGRPSLALTEEAVGEGAQWGLPGDWL